MEVKCRFKDCGKKGEKEDMILHTHVSESGNKYNKYYHPECYEKQKEVDKDEEEKDYLNDTIKRIHGVEDALNLPTEFWSMYLTPLRHGTVVIGKKKKKRYKKGFSYKLIAETYLFCEKKILWAKNNVEFDGLMSELRYCFAIIRDKIKIVQKRHQKSEDQRKQNEALKENQQEDDVLFMEREVKYNRRRKKNKNDISEFLD